MVCGTHQQFKNLCDHAAQSWEWELKNKMVHYVEQGGAEDLEKVQPCRVFFYGTYYRRDDIDFIKQIVREKKHRPLIIR